LTLRQRDVPARVVGGLSVVATIGLLMLLAQGYHTTVLISIGVMLVIGALTFTYDRSNRLSELVVSELIVFACIGIFSLMLQGYRTLVFVIVGTIAGIVALAFISYDGPHVWSWWFPDQSFNPTIKRWLRYLLQAGTVAFAYVQARFYINALTGVDPGNFPTALAALTALNTVVMGLTLLPIVLMGMSAVYAGAMFIAGIQEKIGLTETISISRRRWGFRALGAGCFMFACLMAVGFSADHSWVQGVARSIASTVLVATEFSHDRTCAVSSEHRLVAQLKDRRERPVSMVSIAEEGARAWWLFRHITFSTGTCDDQRQP
jgi:hypothetical protein